MAEIVQHLVYRAASHDHSKLSGLEKQTFDAISPMLSKITYGSEEYRENLRKAGDGIKQHHHSNRHHPEFFNDGISGMTLIDLIEMFCDWKAGSLRHPDGDLANSIAINKNRFAIADQLIRIFENTQRELDW